MKIFTIGFSKKNARRFFGILKQASVQKLLDIRLNNKSQLAGFTKGSDLQFFCEECFGISYEHVPLLAPSDDILKKYRKDKNWQEYETAFLSLLEKRPIINIFKKASKNAGNICLLCSEPTAEHCHRKLVAEFIQQRLDHIDIIHLI